MTGYPTAGGRSWGLHRGRVMRHPASMNGHLFTIGHDATGEPIRQPLHLMTPAEVLAAVRIQRETVRRLGKAALPLLKRVAADPANRDTGADMNTVARNLKASDADWTTIRELLAERAARQDQLLSLIRAEMPRWNPERVNLPDALAVWWHVRPANRIGNAGISRN